MRHGQCRHPSSRGDILALWVYHQALQANASLLAGHKPILAFSLPLPIKAFIDIGSSNKNSFLNLINSCFSRPETESQRFEGLFLSLKKNRSQSLGMIFSLTCEERKNSSGYLIYTGARKFKLWKSFAVYPLQMQEIEGH